MRDNGLSPPPSRFAYWYLALLGLMLEVERLELASLVPCLIQDEFSRDRHSLQAIIELAGQSCSQMHFVGGGKTS